MIADSIKNAELYNGLSEGIKTGLAFLKNNDFSKMTPGRYEIDGNKVYALVQSYESKPLEAGKWESHRKYIDIQYIASGIERMGYANISNLKVSQEYNEEADYLLLEGEGSFLSVKSGDFLIFYPEDGHMPGIAAASPSLMVKVVVKVRV